MQHVEYNENPTHDIDVADRLIRFGQVAQLTDQILNPVVSTLTIVQDAFAPAGWTDGKKIWLNATALPEVGETMDKATLTTWMGVNYHELGHTLYSPRKSSKLIKMIANAIENVPKYNGLRRVENLIEDQRQERLMVMRFRNLTPYLVDAVTTLVIDQVSASDPNQTNKGQEDIGKAWPWLAGRTWLPDDVRKASLAAFDGDGVKLAELIGTYQRFVDPANVDANDAFDVLAEIHDLIQDLPQFKDIELPKGCGGRKGDVIEIRNGGQPKPGTQAGDETEEAPSAGSEEDTATSPPDDEGEGEGSGEEGEGEGPSVTGVTDADEPTSKGDTVGGGTGDKSNETMADLEKSLKEVVTQAIKNDDTFKDHLKKVEDAVNLDQSDGESGLSEAGNTQLREGGAKVKGAANRLSVTFRKFVEAAMPYWEHETDSGKLNVQRYLNRTGFDYDTMFDRHVEGMMDDVSLDVTILLDVSSSMGDLMMPDGSDYYEWRAKYLEDHPGVWPDKVIHANAGIVTVMDLASEACWVIQKAVERADGTTTVVGYNSSAFLISQTGDKPHSSKVRYVQHSGSTRPDDAINDTYRRLKGVDAAHQVVVAITDGDWYSGGDVMRKISKTNVTTVGVLIRSGFSPYSGAEGGEVNRYKKDMGVEHFASIKNPMDMVALFESVIVDALSEVVGSVFT